MYGLAHFKESVGRGPQALLGDCVEVLAARAKGSGLALFLTVVGEVCVYVCIEGRGRRGMRRGGRRERKEGMKKEEGEGGKERRRGGKEGRKGGEERREKNFCFRLETSVTFNCLVIALSRLRESRCTMWVFPRK